MAEEDEAAARRRGGPARDRRLRGGRRRLNGDGDGDGADDGPRRARGGRRARGRREEEARGRGAEAGERCGKRRSWSSHLPVAMGWIDLAADMEKIGIGMEFCSNAIEFVGFGIRSLIMLFFML